MNYEQLRGIIKNIKSKLTCPACKANFMSSDISIIQTDFDKVTLLIQCHECQAPIMVVASMSDEQIITDKKEDMLETIQNILEPNETVTSTTKVKVDDVVNMHEFLRDFSGDFSHIFTNKGK